MSIQRLEARSCISYAMFHAIPACVPSATKRESAITLPGDIYIAYLTIEVQVDIFILVCTYVREQSLSNAFTINRSSNQQTQSAQAEPFGARASYIVCFSYDTRKREFGRGGRSTSSPGKL